MSIVKKSNINWHGTFINSPPHILIKSLIMVFTMALKLATILNWCTSARCNINIVPIPDSITVCQRLINIYTLMSKDESFWSKLLTNGLLVIIFSQTIIALILLINVYDGPFFALKPLIWFKYQHIVAKCV